VPIIRRTYFIYATLCACYFVWMTVWYAGSNENLHTRQSSIQNNKYQVSLKYSCFSWWWAHSRPKHIEKRNKHTKKNCAPSWFYLQDYTGLHGQQNLKNEIMCWLQQIIHERYKFWFILNFWICVVKSGVASCLVFKNRKGPPRNTKYRKLCFR
jgi:hypothetical protein